MAPACAIRTTLFELDQSLEGTRDALERVGHGRSASHAGRHSMHRTDTPREARR